MALESHDLIELLLKACPTAAKAWSDHLEWWGDEKRGYFNDMSVFAQHVVECDSQSRTAELPAFFGLIEKLITEGSEEVRGLAVVGLLETIQNQASHTPQGSTRLEQYLLPHSRQAWNELISLWDGKSSLMDVIRSQRRGDA
jgi:hypothetical protein